MGYSDRRCCYSCFQHRFLHERGSRAWGCCPSYWNPLSHPESSYPLLLPPKVQKGQLKYKPQSKCQEKYSHRRLYKFRTYCPNGNFHSSINWLIKVLLRARCRFEWCTYLGHVLYKVEGSHQTLCFTVIIKSCVSTKFTWCSIFYLCNQLKSHIKTWKSRIQAQPSKPLKINFPQHSHPKWDTEMRWPREILLVCVCNLRS